MNEEVLRTEHVSKSFGRVTALRDASIHLSKGEVLGLLGDNGAGKSTLLKILTGFHRPSSGKIYFEGKEIAAQICQPRPLARYRASVPGSRPDQRA